MRPLRALKPKQDRRVSGTYEAAGFGSRLLRHRAVHSLGDKDQTCAHPVRFRAVVDPARVLAVLFLGVCCMVCPPACGQVGRPPIITKQPQSQVAEIGSSASFSVELANYTTAKFQWELRAKTATNFTSL